MFLAQEFDTPTVTQLGRATATPLGTATATPLGTATATPLGTAAATPLGTADDDPYVSAHRLRLIQPDTRSRLIGYLSTAPVAAVGYRTDGEWVWPESLAGQVRLRGAAPQAQFYEHLRSRRFLLPDKVTDETVEQAERAAAGPVTPDPPSPETVFMAGYRAGGDSPVTLLKLVRRDDGSTAEFCLFADGWGGSDFLKRMRDKPGPNDKSFAGGDQRGYFAGGDQRGYFAGGDQRGYFAGGDQRDNFVEISDRAAAELADQKWAAHHGGQVEAARESEETPGPLRIARVFDGQSSTGTPCFSPSRLRIPEPVRRERLAAYLRAGRLVVRATSRMVDPLDPTLGRVVPLNYRTDGTWVWQEALAHYVGVRGAAPELAFLCHIEERGYVPPAAVPDEAVAQATAAVRAGQTPPVSHAMTYYMDGQALARARNDSVFEADRLRADLRWGQTDVLWRQFWQGSDYDYRVVSQARAIQAIDDQWAAGNAAPPIDY